MPLICVNHDLGVVVIPKSASNTVMRSIYFSEANWLEVSPQEFIELPKRVAFIREPHARAVSAFRMYTKTGCGRRHDLSSFENFILGICRDDDNDPHVMPQMRLCRQKGMFLPERLIKWDFIELARTLDLKPEKVPHVNPSSASIETSWTPELLDTFDSHFADDLELWSS